MNSPVRAPNSAPMVPRRERILLWVGSVACLLLAAGLAFLLSGSWDAIANQLSEWWELLTEGSGSFFGRP